MEAKWVETAGFVVKIGVRNGPIGKVGAGQIGNEREGHPRESGQGRSSGCGCEERRGDREEGIAYGSMDRVLRYGRKGSRFESW
jgi:hypothetical protein